MDKVTQANAAGAEETASASEELNAQAEIMRDSVRSLQQLVDGSNGESAAATARKVPKKNARPEPATAAPANGREEAPAYVSSRSNGAAPAMNGAGHADGFFK
jgi:methyl-accepting chemotaxis protein